MFLQSVSLSHDVGVTYSNSCFTGAADMQAGDGVDASGGGALPRVEGATLKIMEFLLCFPFFNNIMGMSSENESSLNRLAAEEHQTSGDGCDDDDEQL